MKNPLRPILVTLQVYLMSMAAVDAKTTAEFDRIASENGG